MGEYAEYMINGDDCQECGQHIGSGDGYPRSCAGCSRSEKRERRNDPDAPFIMQNTRGAVVALKHWLKKRKFNGWTLGQVDKRGKPIIGLSWEHDPDKTFTKHDRAGLIICRDQAAYDAAIKVIEGEPDA